MNDFQNRKPPVDAQSEGYDRAVALLQACATDSGFVASPTESDNYRRVWSRDGAVLTLAALATGDESLIDAGKRTLLTLAEHQGPHGEIPSNVDTDTGRVSYGGTAGRVDGDLWFLVAAAEFCAATGAADFRECLLPVADKVAFLLGAWEYNNRGLLYVPLTGDWADEYLHNGYVLYDQLLYYQAQLGLASLRARRGDASDHVLPESISRLRHVIRANYWFHDGEGVPDDAYHEVLYRKGLRAAEKKRCADCHWLPSFAPSGYGYRFDALANVLASLFDVADDEQRARVDAHIDTLTHDDLPLLPAFHPVIRPVDEEDWEDLQMMFSYSFKNKPYEYHNGGLWPMVTGFYVADLARRGERDRARRHLAAIHAANALPMAGEDWGFPEYVHGRELTPGGTRHQGWSAAAAIIGHQALAGQEPLRVRLPAG